MPRSFTPLLLLACWLAAHPAAAQEEDFADQISVTAVEIPVRVLVKGKPLRGLTVEDFELYDQGELQEITGFSVNDLSAFAPPSETASPGPLEARAPEGRTLLLVVDYWYSERRHLSRALDGVREMVESRLHPADRVAIATYSALTGLEILVGFTHEPVRLGLALDAVEAMVDGKGRLHDEKRRDLERLLAHEGRLASEKMQRFQTLAANLGPSAAMAAESRTGGVASSDDVGRVVLPGARRSLHQQKGFRGFGPAKAVPPVGVGQGLLSAPDRSNVRFFALSMAEMATLLRNLGGQKQVLYLSQGFSSGLLDDAAVLHHVQKMLRAYRSTGWTFNAVNIAGLESGFSADGLHYLAKETGGELVENVNRLTAATDRLLNRTSVGYVLTFQPAAMVPDGSFRVVEVKLKNPPKGARVFHRPGYYAPRTAEDRSLLESRIDAAEIVLTEIEEDDIATEVLAAPLGGSEASARALVVVEASGRDLLAGAGKKRLRLEVHACALDADGRVWDLLIHGARLDLGQLREIVAAGGVRFVGQLDLPAGSYRLRVMVRNLDSGQLFAATYPLEIAPTAGGPLLQPMFLGAPASWVSLHDLPSPTGELPPRALTLGDESLLPAALPSLAPGETVAMALLGSGLDELSITGRVRAAAEGAEPSSASLDLAATADRTRDGVEVLTATFGPGALPPGDYLLEVEGARPDAPPLAGSVPFRVVEPR